MPLALSILQSASASIWLPTTVSVTPVMIGLYAQGSFRNIGAGERPILSFVTHPAEQEAAALVAAEIERLRNLSYGELLVSEGQPEHRPIETADQATLVLETQVFWDDREQRNLRVTVDVWDPSKCISGSIVINDFIRAPDGSFVGE
jgi:hypothetical protein